MLPPTIPLFPLPNVVLFPNVFLPLHIFEARYRAMVADALDGDRIIGVALLQPGFELEYEGRPPIFSVGSAGVITHSETLPDGRFNIVLRGLEKFRVVSEDASGPYRVARIQSIPETTPQADTGIVSQQRLRLEALMAAAAERRSGEPRFAPAVPDEDVVNALAQYLDFEPLERQALLERDGVLSRCRALIALMEMKRIVGSDVWKCGPVH